MSPTAKPPESFVSINPQKLCHAAAFWVDGKLSSARILSIEPGDWLIRSVFTTLVIEIPQIYRAGHQHKTVDPADLIDVAYAAGRISAGFAHVRKIRPAEWKKQVPKPERSSKPYIIAERLKERLRPFELKEVRWPGDWQLRNDLWDAIGIGMWHLSRYPQKPLPY